MKQNTQKMLDTSKSFQCQRYEKSLISLGVRPAIARDAAIALVSVPASEWTYDQKVQISAAVAAIISKKIKNPPAETLDEQARASAQLLEGQGAPAGLAEEASTVLAYKPIPWTISDQAILKRAWYSIFSSRLEPRRLVRVDSEGRDVTDLPGLWDESDVYQEPAPFSVPIPGDPDYDDGL